MRESVERETGEREGSARAKPLKKNAFFHHLDKVATSFFISNFPDAATTGELWKLFQKFGRVGEVYIPKKVDKKGRRFGFVKFKEVNDVEALCDSMKEVWMGSFKLWVNLARFQRAEVIEEQPKSAPASRPVLTQQERRPGLSFRTALVGDTSKRAEEVLHVPVNEDLCKELCGSMVGTLAREKDVRRIQTTLFMEGFRSITVTHMGGNMVLLRSSVAGDVERLMRSKNECITYYFSDLKPWNPGLIAVQREVWVQVYGIPVHIWGEKLFKVLGNRLGVFLDFDMETASLARFDVARIKVLSSKWAFLDDIVKVEAEGVGFDLWVVEERGNQRSVVVLNGEMEDEGSHACMAEGSVPGDVGENSGEDDVSGDESEVEMRKKGAQNVCLEKERDKSGCLPLVGNVGLTFDKSTNPPNTFKETPAIPNVGEDTEVLCVRPDALEMVLAVSEEREGKRKGGVIAAEERVCQRENISECGSQERTDLFADVAEISNSPPDPVNLGLMDPGQLVMEAQFNGVRVQEADSRYSTLSEPEEVLGSHRPTNPKSKSKMRKQKSCSKFNSLGVPKCIKLVEVLKEAGPMVRKRRQAEAEVAATGDEGDEDEATTGSLMESDGNIPSTSRLVRVSSTPASGINHIAGSDMSFVPDSLPQNQTEEKGKLIEAAKLLNIQLEVGFNFEEASTQTLKYLVEQENCDRAKKMEWENRIVDQ
jgi:hypothetical protein